MYAQYTSETPPARSPQSTPRRRVRTRFVLSMASPPAPLESRPPAARHARPAGGNAAEATEAAEAAEAGRRDESSSSRGPAAETSRGCCCCCCYQVIRPRPCHDARRSLVCTPSGNRPFRQALSTCTVYAYIRLHGHATRDIATYIHTYTSARPDIHICSTHTPIPFRITSKLSLIPLSHPLVSLFASRRSSRRLPYPNPRLAPAQRPSPRLALL
jgi:hypothetical protein